MLNNHFHTHLPAEIFSFPGEVPDDETRKELEKYGATLRVVESATRDGSRTKNYHIKVRFSCVLP
jgi:alpha 1,2-mannosyltransferase